MLLVSLLREWNYHTWQFAKGIVNPIHWPNLSFDGDRDYNRNCLMYHFRRETEVIVQLLTFAFCVYFLQVAQRKKLVLSTNSPLTSELFHYHSIIYY